MDFIKGLHTSEIKNQIFVVVDKYIKCSYFRFLTQLFTTFVSARMFLDNVYKLHGFTQSIVSDRDKNFINLFWKELLTLLGAEAQMHTTNFPQIDGQSEKVNQILKIYLRCVTYQSPKKWNSWLALVER